MTLCIPPLPEGTPHRALPIAANGELPPRSCARIGIDITSHIASQREMTLYYLPKIEAAVNAAIADIAANMFPELTFSEAREQ